jgi:hypothetical protein
MCVLKKPQRKNKLKKKPEIRIQHTLKNLFKAKPQNFITPILQFLYSAIRNQKGVYLVLRNLLKGTILF